MMDTTTTNESSADNAAAEIPPVRTRRRWARIGALIYDPFLWVGELVGMRRVRSSVLGQACGRVVEIGAGTGLNLTLYPPQVSDLVLVEPELAMRTRLERRLRRGGQRALVIDGKAERLPLASASVDTVVCTLVLCTVEVPERALAEIARVLRPGGQLLFIEHVRAESPALACWQDRLTGAWRRFACGCRCNRSTVELMRGCGFEVDARPHSWRAMPPIVRPLLAGRATYEGSDQYAHGA